MYTDPKHPSRKRATPMMLSCHMKKENHGMTLRCLKQECFKPR